METNLKTVRVSHALDQLCLRLMCQHAAVHCSASYAAFRQKGHRARSAAVMLDKMTNRSRGFGFVTFDTEKDLMDSIASMHDSDLDGRKISCTKAIPQSETAPGTPASALAGTLRGSSRYGSLERSRDRAYDRLDRPPPRGYSARAYDDRRGGYDRGGYGYGRPERGYDRGG